MIRRIKYCVSRIPVSVNQRKKWRIFDKKVLIAVLLSAFELFLLCASPSRTIIESDPALYICYPAEGDYITCEEDWSMVSVQERPGSNAVRVDFFLDDQLLSRTYRAMALNPERYAATAPFSSVTSGSHTLRAFAVDKSGQQAWSAPVNFFVNRYPVITIISPKEDTDVWRSIHIAANVTDDFGLRNVVINRQAFDKPPYELDLSLSHLSEDFEYSEYISFKPNESQAWIVKSGAVVFAEDSLGLQTSVSPRIRIKRLFYPDSISPTFDWWSFFHHRYPETRYQNTDETKSAITPDIYSMEWSVVFSIDPVFQNIAFTSPSSDGRLVAEWRPSSKEWLAILKLGKDRPNDDVPVYFRIVDGERGILWQDYFVVSRAEPLSAAGFVTDQEGNKFPCGKHTDHNASYILEVSDNPNFLGTPIYSQIYQDAHYGPLVPSERCGSQAFPLPLSQTTACKLQENHEKLFVRFRATDILGRETITQVYPWPRNENCSHER